MRSIEHLHPVTKPPFGFKPITVPVGLEEKANGQYMLDRFSKDQEEGALNRRSRNLDFGALGRLKRLNDSVKDSLLGARQREQLRMPSGKHRVMTSLCLGPQECEVGTEQKSDTLKPHFSGYQRSRGLT